MATSILPQLGPLFRTIVTSAGYRRRLTELGLDKDLDDMALDARKGSSADMLLQLEETVQHDLAMDCGAQWAQVLRWAWGRTREALQDVARQVDITPITEAVGREAVHRELEVPIMAGVIKLISHQFQGVKLEKWWVNPINEWVVMTAGIANLPEKEIASRLHDTTRTIDRWMAGDPVRELQFPFRPTVLKLFWSSDAVPGVTVLDQLTGWLMLSVTFQSLPRQMRDAMRKDFEIRRQQPWSINAAIAKVQHQCWISGDQPIREHAIPLLQQIQLNFSAKHRDLHAVEHCLRELQHLVNQESSFWQQSYQYILDWFTGRLASIQGREADAMSSYSAAVDGAWWRGGPNQQQILREALLYAVGVGDLVKARHFWDRTFMLGLNQWPKRPLDEQERRRLAFSFEQQFAPQKAKDRIPPPFETIVREGSFELTRDQLKKPNQHVKHAGGRTRRTPLMDAIREGTLADVKCALAAGGDPNDYIKESGEGPLTYAMRRACDRGDTIIMDHLLRLELSSETVNRQASTSRETPLKIAIEMADASAVERLIVLGADVERATDYVPSALCYAMLLLHGSIHRGDRTQEDAYLAGKSRADAHDAKGGAALDADLAERRQKQAALRDASPRHRAMFDAVMEHFTRPVEPRRKVVKNLLRLGANPNRRYKVEHEDLAEWTPTLFAAQVGDLDVFKSMLEHGGDAEALLMQSSSLDRQDAMWVAVGHGQYAIVKYLIERTHGSQTVG